MWALFVLTTMEGWERILYNAVDSRGIYLQPVQRERLGRHSWQHSLYAPRRAGAARPPGPRARARTTRARRARAIPIPRGRCRARPVPVSPIRSRARLPPRACARVGRAARSRTCSHSWSPT
jgi:hypothetical protein